MSRKPLMNMCMSLLLFVPLTATAQIFQIRDPLPDLVPVDITLDSGCRITVSLRNAGPGVVPDAGYAGSATGIQMYDGANPWGGIALGAMDPTHLSKPVGGTVSYAWFPGLTLSAGTHTLSLTADNNNTLAEANEGNNVLTKTVNCQPPMPDLVPVSIGLNLQCQLTITLKNQGTGIVPDAGFTPTGAASSAVQMYVDGQPFGGISLGGMDTTKQVQPVGGTVTYAWFPNLKLTQGGHVVNLVVDNSNSIVESNEANNSMTQKMFCGPILTRQ
jgi:hypothetical protein